MKQSRASSKLVKRGAITGAITLGLVGFGVGCFVCLHYKLPIPPLFITELGFIVGGCLGALAVLLWEPEPKMPTHTSQEERWVNL